MRSLIPLPRKVFEKKVRFLFSGWLLDLVMRKYLLPILLMSLLYWSCEEEALPDDCLGVEGGNALVDSCGILFALYR